MNNIVATVKTDPELSVVRGRNGVYWMHAITVTAYDNHVTIEGAGIKHAGINGGFRLNRAALIELCREVLRQEGGES
jgi:hypothetical protein